MCFLWILCILCKHYVDYIFELWASVEFCWSTFLFALRPNTTSHHVPRPGMAVGATPPRITTHQNACVSLYTKYYNLAIVSAFFSLRKRLITTTLMMEMKTMTRILLPLMILLMSILLGTSASHCINKGRRYDIKALGFIDLVMVPEPWYHIVPTADGWLFSGPYETCCWFWWLSPKWP